MELLRVYLDSTEDAIFVLCDEMKFLVCNRKMEQWLGKAESELTEHNKRTPIPNLLGNNDSLKIFIESFHQTLADKSSRFECYLEPAEGEKRWAEIQLNKVQVESGDMVIVVARDISERKASEIELDKFRASLEDQVKMRTAALEIANQELDTFFFSVSHDLRTPLRAINGYSQILQENFNEHLNDEAKGYLGKVRDTSQYMGVLIDELLKLSRINRAELDITCVDLSRLAGKIGKHIQELEPLRKAKIIIQPGLETQGDTKLLRIALENLLSNSWKYTEDTNAVEIEVGSIQSDGETVFYVKDNGSGFDMAYADKLFNVFERLHGREIEGNGIGLSTVKRIIDRHNGRIWAKSAPKEGATFYFTVGS
jgi:PAS domain S-box-containing protein